MSLTFVLLITLVLLISVAAQQGVESSSDDLVFTIDHRLGENDFSHRTKIHLVKKADGKQALMFPEKNGIFGADIQTLKNMLDSNSLYTIRIQTHLGDESSVPVLTSIPICELQKSGFKEDITVHLDPKQSIIGVSYSSPTSTVSRECDPAKVKDVVPFQTRIKLGDSVPIQWIPLKAVGARPAGMKDVKLGPEDNTAKPEKKTFLQQYWYIVVIMVVYMFLGRAEPGKAPASEVSEGASAAAPATAK